MQLFCIQYVLLSRVRVSTRQLLSDPICRNNVIWFQNHCIIYMYLARHIFHRALLVFRANNRLLVPGITFDISCHLGIYIFQYVVLKAIYCTSSQCDRGIHRRNCAIQSTARWLKSDWMAYLCHSDTYPDHSVDGMTELHTVHVEANMWYCFALV